MCAPHPKNTWCYLWTRPIGRHDVVFLPQLEHKRLSSSFMTASFGRLDVGGGSCVSWLSGRPVYRIQHNNNIHTAAQVMIGHWDREAVGGIIKAYFVWVVFPPRPPATGLRDPYQDRALNLVGARYVRVIRESCFEVLSSRKKW